MIELPPRIIEQADRDRAEAEWEQFDGLESITIIEMLYCRERELLAVLTEIESLKGIAGRALDRAQKYMDKAPTA